MFITKLEHEDDGKELDYYFIAQSGGNYNSRMMKGVGIPAHSNIAPGGHEFAGIIDMSGFVVLNDPTQAPTDEPTVSPPTDHPTGKAPTDHPTGKAPTDNPTGKAPTQYPTDGTPTSFPTEKKKNDKKNKKPSEEKKPPKNKKPSKEKKPPKPGRKKPPTKKPSKEKKTPNTKKPVEKNCDNKCNKCDGLIKRKLASCKRRCNKCKENINKKPKLQSARQLNDGNWLVKAGDGKGLRKAKFSVSIEDKLIAIGLQAHNLYMGAVHAFDADRGGQIVLYAPENIA